ncbi:hypothetical protein [Persephonella sp.]
MVKIVGKRVFIKNLILISLSFISFLIMTVGYFYLFTDDLKIAKEIIKTGEAEIELISGDKIKKEIIDIKKKDDDVVLIFKDGSIPLKFVVKLNDRDVNGAIITALTERAVKGIFFVVSGGFLLLFTFLIRGYI